MTPPPTEQIQLDVVTVAVVAIAALAGGEVARYAGPYLVIIMAALVGAVGAEMRRPSGTRTQAVGFILLITLMSVLLTGALAALGVTLLGHVGLATDARFLLVPISGGIAYIGHDWPAVAAWAGGLAKKISARRLGAGQCPPTCC